MVSYTTVFPPIFQKLLKNNFPQYFSHNFYEEFLTSIAVNVSSKQRSHWNYRNKRLKSAIDWKQHFTQNIFENSLRFKTKTVYVGIKFKIFALKGTIYKNGH